MSGGDALRGFLGKWHARWPEWAIGVAFVPEARRDAVAAWLALRDELAEAAWGGGDARPGEAKLAWWGEELRGWAKGARRHPLGFALQPLPADWKGLAANLPALAASRGAGSVEAAAAAAMPFAAGAESVARQLFDAGGADAAQAEALSLLGERLLREAGAQSDADVAAAACDLLATWPRAAAGARPLRVHRAFVQRRLRRLAANKTPTAGRIASLFDAWNAARG